MVICNPLMLRFLRAKKSGGYARIVGMNGRQLLTTEIEEVDARNAHERKGLINNPTATRHHSIGDFATFFATKFWHLMIKTHFDASIDKKWDLSEIDNFQIGFLYKTGKSNDHNIMSL